MKIQLFSTMERRLLPFEPISAGKVGLYTCGPTVYNFAHIGNFRAYMFEDILKRTLEYFGYEVRHVMNLTDVDDKTIRDSRARGMKLRDFTQQYKEAFFSDIKSLNIEPATVYPAATDHIAEMIALISKLFEKGYAYQAEDGSVYFSIEKFAGYGKLAHIDRDNQRAGVRINADEYAKDSVADFALWKHWDENDGDVKWDSPWGPGRPGWHIECSAMSTKYLGEQFDIHTGGIDNMFPHHEDEIAQSEAASGRKWVNYWLHCEHLMVNGEKMSKSLGNFFTLRDLFDKGWKGSEIRYVLFGTHYRKKLNFTFDALKQAREALGKFGELFARMRSIDAAGDGTEAVEAASKAVDLFERSMADDLNTAAAMSAWFDLMRAANHLADGGKLSAAGAKLVLDAFRKFDRIAGMLEVDAERVAEAIPEEIVAMAEARAAARGNKDWAESDRLRNEIAARGFVVEDVPGNKYRLKKNN